MIISSCPCKSLSDLNPLQGQRPSISSSNMTVRNNQTSAIATNTPTLEGLGDGHGAADAPAMETSLH